ncbi:hypothetical protein VPH35_042668 [Triticum aestivum]
MLVLLPGSHNKLAQRVNCSGRPAGFVCAPASIPARLLCCQRHTSGNGFIVSNNKTICDIVSCQHVVKMLPVGGTMAVYFFNSDGLIPRRYNARIIRTDEGRDLAWLRAQDVYEPVTCLRFFDPPYASGWNVVALAYTTLDGSSATILEPGTYSGQITNEPDEVSLTCSCTSKQGASGSPLILPRIDRVVGVLAGASHASVYAVPVTHIREFLIEWLGGDEDLNEVRTAGLVMLVAKGQ